MTVKGGGEGRKVMNAVINDERFTKQQSDPRFQRVPMKKKKVVVDNRFKAMMGEGSAFARQAVTDKYGRKVKHEIKEDLGRFYQMEDEDEGEDGSDEGEGEEEEEVMQKGKKKAGGKGKGKGREEEEEEEEEGDGQKKKKKKKKKEKEKEKKKQQAKTEEEEESGEEDSEGSKGMKGMKGKKGKKGKKEPRLAGQAAGMDMISESLKGQDLRSAMMNWASSSSDDDHSADEADRLEEERLCDEAVDVSKPLIPVENYVPEGDETRRIAVVNIDWDKVKAIDVLMLLRSFAPSNGQVKNVKIYMSQFGKERIEHERHHGPGMYISDGAKKPAGSDGEEDSDQDDEVNMVRLRKYEADKLKYYYAIAECDSSRTAKTIYDQCDGVEYEASSQVMDLRYVPDSETFDEAPTSQAAGEAPPDYVSPFFVNKALGHTKCELTWDLDAPERDVLKGKNLSGKGKKKQRNAEMDAIDYSAFMESSDSGEDEEEEKRNKARALLLAGSDDDPFSVKGGGPNGGAGEEGGDMEITFTPGLGALGEGLLKKKGEREAEKEMSTWEKYQKKVADRKAEAKKGRKGKGDDDEERTKDLPEGSEFVDDSFFENDPFFALPGEEGGEDGEEGGKGVFKKKKAAKEEERRRAAEEKREEQRGQKERKDAELAMLKKVMGDSKGEKKGFEIKLSALGRASQKAGEEVSEGGKKKKGKKRRAGEEEEQEDDFKLNVEDNRFSAVYSNPKFALDPTDPNFRKTPGLSKILEAGRTKRSRTDEPPPEAEPKSSSGAKGGGGKGRDSELAALVTSLKGKKWGAGK